MSDGSDKPPLTLKEAILDASWDGEAPAIEAIDGRVMTHSQMRSHMGRIVGMLNGAGFRRGDRFATVLANGADQFAILVALMAGFTVVPINPNFKEAEMTAYMGAARVKAAVVDGGPDCSGARVAKGMGLEVYELIRGGLAGSLEVSLKGRGLDECPQQTPEFSTQDDTMVVFGTSGTTGKPKLVPLKQSNVLWAHHFYHKNLGDFWNDRCLAFLPIFYSHGLIAPLRTLYWGGCVVYTPNFDPLQFYKWLDISRATWMTAGPTTYQAILEHAAENAQIIARNRLRLISTGNAAMPLSVMERLEGLFGAPLVETYAMTEAPIITSSPLPPAKVKRGSAGISWGTEVAIMGDDGSMLPPGEAGEVVIRGKVVMEGYEGNPEANQAAFKNGWFRTGDLGYFDGDGYLFIRGRLKDIINKGGEKVVPQDVEEALLSHPAVKEAAVFPVRHRRLGEDVAAAAVLWEGAMVSEGELMAHVAERLALFKVPSRVHFVGGLPKGPTGKVNRAGLAESLGSKGTAPPEAEHVPPRTEAERRLIGILGGIFPGIRIGAKDSFFDLGGYSLMAVRLFAEIEKEFGVRLPLSTLFQHPTVEGMAAMLASRRPDGGWPTLVPLQEKGSRPPLFLVHGGDGDVLNYRELVQALGEGRRIYGIQARGLDGREEPEEDLVVMARGYVSGVLGVQPDGPYYLAGFSAGGMIAFEMARQLEAMGKRVHFVGIIDMDVPDRTAAGKRRNFRRALFREVFFLARDLMPSSRRRRAGVDLRVMPRLRGIWRLGIASLGAWRGEASEILPAEAVILPEARRRVWRAQMRAVDGYMPGCLQGRVTVFSGERVPIIYPTAGEMGWERHAKGGVEVHVVPGRIHGKQMRSPNVRYLAEMMKRSMERAGSAL